MSDPLGQRDAEDVLSSVKRQVSETAPAQPEALVLTAALRVGEDDDPSADDTVQIEGTAAEDVIPTQEDASQPSDVSPDSDVTPDPELFADDAAIIDEETLRDMVSEIVREELQGVLGERITRNVRKLVRREIHRALAAQDLE
ncbi:MAG: hypothetical protein AAF729_01150 [Pseudomonadota bacterium]